LYDRENSLGKTTAAFAVAAEADLSPDDSQRSVRWAWLLVGSTPSILAKVYSAG
jgi:hypothetical protein